MATSAEIPPSLSLTLWDSFLFKSKSFTLILHPMILCFPRNFPTSYPSFQFTSDAQLCPMLCIPMECSMPGFPVLYQLLELAQTHVHQVGDAIKHLILSCPLHLLPSVFPSTRLISNESVLRIRWPKYWSFRFSISPSNECSGLISFRIHWFDLSVRGTLKSLLQYCSLKASVL